MADKTFTVFRKYTFQSEDKHSARKVWQGACANEQEEEFLTYEGMPKEENQPHGWVDTAKKQLAG